MLDFVDGSPTELASRLLGLTLTSRGRRGVVSLQITETEAYAGAGDPASHAYRGLTARNEVMFEAGGVLYVYRSHGLHWCCNIVTGPPGVASAVLLRAGRIVDGVSLARERRGPTVPDNKLASGPGNLTQALGIGAADNRRSVSDAVRFSLSGELTPAATVTSGPRVGVTYAPDVPWRFSIADDPTVSNYRRSPRAATNQAS